jgi:surface antigen
MRIRQLFLVVACFGALSVLPTAASASTISVSGVVHCNSGSVVGVWVQSNGGGSKFASWRAFNTSSTNAAYGTTLSTKLPTSVQLRVGCGGSPAKWGTTNNSPNRSVSGSKVLNAFCDARGHCTWPLKGRTTTYNLGYHLQCTEGALKWWQEYTGFWPQWRGNAAEWATTAASYGYTVTTVAMPKSIVVFPGTRSNSAGHVAWVDSISQSSSGAITLNVLEENYDGSASRPTGHIRRYAYAASSSYHYIPAP